MRTDAERLQQEHQTEIRSLRESSSAELESTRQTLQAEIRSAQTQQREAEKAAEESQRKLEDAECCYCVKVEQLNLRLADTRDTLSSRVGEVEAELRAAQQLISSKRVSYLRSGVDTDAYELLCNASACLEPAAAFVRRCYARDYQIQEQLQLFDAMCSVGLNDIPCYEALDESSISWGSCFTTVNNNGALGSCSYWCRRELIEASIDLGCCLRRVYDVPAAARLDYLDSELWSACGVSIPSEGDCKFNPQRAAAGEMAGPATVAAILVFTLLALWI